MKTFQEFVESAKNIALDEIHMIISPTRSTRNEPEEPPKEVKKPNPKDPGYVEKYREYIEYIKAKKSQFIKEVTGSFHYGSERYQQKLEKERRESDQRKKEQQEKETTQARTDFRSGGFIRGTKGGKSGKFYKNAATGKYTIFVPDNQ